MVLLLLVAPVTVFSQVVSGTVKDAADASNMPGANVQLRSLDEAGKGLLQVTDLSGQFRFSGLPQGNYILSVSFIGFRSFSDTVQVANKEITLGNILLEPSIEVLDNIEVLGQRLQAIQQGDTTAYNAAAFKTNPDATAEDLVRKMPGIVMQNGTIQAQGEDVRRVLVDGREFFGDDATAALRNLPAEIIDQIQVFDRQSDQAQFSGYEDGEEEKTINIVTKPEMRQGIFGRLSGGYGTDNRYAASGNVNIFDDTRRISILGLANNINEQNFSQQDLAGAMAGGGGGRRGGGRGGRGGGRGGGGAENFQTGPNRGITQSQSFGINYSDEYGDKTKLTGSYFFNRSDNRQQNNIGREYFLSADSSQFYDEQNSSQNISTSHRLSFRIEHTIDERNSLIIIPRLNLQQSAFTESVEGANFLSGNEMLSSILSDRNGENSSLNFSNTILYRHRFEKRGRTFSARLGTDIDRSTGEEQLFAQNTFFRGQINQNDTIDQNTDILNRGNELSGRLIYTEPFTKKSALRLLYNVSNTRSNSSRETFSRQAEGDIQVPDSLLSNVFESNYLTQSGGVGYRYQGKRGSLNMDMGYQYAQLSGLRSFPVPADIEASFYNFLPSMRYRLRLSEQKNLRINYRTRTNAPSVLQLQDVVDNTNPLQLSRGNPNLQQQYTHGLNLRYSFSNDEKNSNSFIFMNANYVQDYVGRSTIIASEDIMLENNIVLPQGSQLTEPVNLDGFFNLRSFYNYGVPVTKLKSNINLSTNISYNRIPGLINENLNVSNAFTVGQGAVFSSNISENVDFTLSFNANYNIVENSLQPQLNNNFYSQTSSFRSKFIFGPGLTIDSNINHMLFTGLGEGFNQNFFLVNIGVGKRLFPERRGEVKLTIFDLLNQNNSIQRTVTETFIEDTETRVLQQYFMLSFSYNIRSFRSLTAE